MKKKYYMLLFVVILIVFTGCKNNKTTNEKDLLNNANETSQVNENKTVGDNELTLVFGGDVLLSDSMINTYNKDGGKIENILSTELLEEFQNADISMFNQEFPFSLRGTKMEDKQYTFKTDPKYIKIVEEMGVDIVSLANNHTLDFGVEALVDTIDTYDKSEVECAGVGNNIDEAKEIKYLERENKKIAFLCASRVIPVTDWNATSDRAGMLTTYDPTILLQQIKEAEENADYTVVYVHWGLEHKEYPEEYQKTLAKQYIDEGADVVIGCHTHCLQGAEIYNGKPIIYSMGNFMFGGTIDRTMMVKITLDNEIKTQLVPCEEKSYLTYRVDDSEKVNNFYEYYKGISFGVDIDNEGYIINNQ